MIELPIVTSPSGSPKGLKKLPFSTTRLDPQSSLMVAIAFDTVITVSGDYFTLLYIQKLL